MEEKWNFNSKIVLAFTIGVLVCAFYMGDAKLDIFKEELRDSISDIIQDMAPQYEFDINGKVAYIFDRRNGIFHIASLEELIKQKDQVKANPEKFWTKIYGPDEFANKIEDLELEIRDRIREKLHRDTVSKD